MKGSVPTVPLLWCPPTLILTLQPLQLVLSGLQQAASLVPQLLCPRLRSQHALGLALSQGLHCLVLVAQLALQQLGMKGQGQCGGPMEAELLPSSPLVGSASTYLLSLPGTTLGIACCFFSTRGCQTISCSFQFQSLQETIQLLSPLTCRAQRLLCTCHPLLHLP